jgi:hypothetical protein
VSYSGAPGLEDDWIGLFRESDPDSGPLSRKYLEGSDNGSIEFYLPEAGGKYNFRMFEGDSFERLAETRALEVKASSGVHVTATPETAKVGQKITVSFWGGPEGRGGVIGMYIMTKADKFYMQMKNLDGRRCGTLTFVPPGPGKYDFRMFQNNVYRQLMGQSNVVTVS